MENNVGIRLQDPTKYRDEVQAATAFNQESRKVVSSRSSKYASFFKKRQSQSSKSIDSIAERETCHQLATEGNLEGLKSALETPGTNLKDPDVNGATLLHRAAMGNKVEVMKYLIESGIALDLRDNDGNTALHVAVQTESIDALHVLLNSGASDVVLNNKEEAAIHVAVKLGYVVAVRALLDHPIDVIVTGYRKRTALHIAAELDRVEIFRVFHEYARAQFGKNGKLRLCSTDEDDLTPMHLAARKGSHRVLSLCLEVCKEHGYLQETILSFLDEENSTPLHAAIDGAHAAVVDVLLKNGASPIQSKYGYPPPLHMACSQGKLDMVKLMVDHCGSAILHKCDEYQRSPLHFSANSSRCGNLISYIAQYDVDINATDAQNRTALHIAVMSGSLTGVQTLLSKNADPTINDRHGNNALHYAVIHQRKAIIMCLLQLPCAKQLVLDRGINNECTPVHCALKLGYGDLVAPMVAVMGTQIEEMIDSRGSNPLHLAAGNGDSVTLANLFTNSACYKLLNEVNDGGATPLHCAAGSGCSRSVQILLEQGATSHKCHSGATPYMYACLKGHTLCAKRLHQAFPFQRDWRDDQGNTGLHLAVMGGNQKTVELLLDLGSKIMLNFQKESFFDLILKNSDAKCAHAVVSHDRWEECLDSTSPHFPHPMIGLILHLPKVAKQVLDRCHTISTLDKAHPDYWEKFCFKYVRLLRVKPCHDDSDESRQTSDEFSDTSSMVDLDIPSIRYKGSIKESALEIVRKNPNLHSTQALETMVKYNRASLLTHPVVREYLNAKWRDYGGLIYYTVLIVHFLHILFLSIFIAIVPLPKESDNFIASGNESSNSTVPEYKLTVASSGIRAVTLLLCTLNIVPFATFAYVLKIKGLTSIRSVHNVVQLGTILCTYIFLIPPTPIWPAGAVATFCGWFAIIASNAVGIYATMFLRICHTVLTVMSISFLLLLSFGLALHVLAFTLPEFSTVGYSLFTSFGYMLGEIQYSQIVRADIANSFQFGTLVLIFIVILAILLSIVMVNLLIGLSVGDIEKIRRNATTELVSVTVQMFSQIDTTLPKRIIARYDRHCYKNYPNRYQNKVHKYLYIAYTNIKTILDGRTSTDSNEIYDHNNAAEMAAMRQQLSQLINIVREMKDREESRGQLHHFTSPEPHLGL